MRNTLGDVDRETYEIKGLVSTSLRVIFMYLVHKYYTTYVQIKFNNKQSLCFKKEELLVLSNQLFYQFIW